MSPEARTELEATPSSAAEARAFVRQLLAAWDCDDEREVAILLTSELVSNAVRHAATRLALEVRADPEVDVLRIAVRDENGQLPVRREPEVGATGGRGIFLVDTLARRWGADVEDRGKVVWFELGTGRRPGPHS
jgi:anti-sigma regulatory factor (Ser/Thr protein kinase)